MTVRDRTRGVNGIIWIDLFLVAAKTGCHRREPGLHTPVILLSIARSAENSPQRNRPTHPLYEASNQGIDQLHLAKFASESI
jgi:hypothetical protein